MRQIIRLDNSFLILPLLILICLMFSFVVIFPVDFVLFFPLMIRCCDEAAAALLMVVAQVLVVVVEVVVVAASMTVMSGLGVLLCCLPPLL